MTPDIKAKWTAALRGGKYVQTRRGYLQKDGCFCCLGVLCDIIDPSQWATDARSDTRWDGNIATLPSVIYQRSGLNADASGDLITMNDTDKTFAQIADWIEENL